jgi:hypothetical protein
MIELPLNVKYDFRSGKRSSWFGVAGISSYFMNKEEYQYRYTYNNQVVQKQASFDDASTIWGSVLNVSLGYSRNVGKSSALRIEPYIKMPFKGFGSGDLPITSAGIYFGFTKKLF